MRLAEEVAGGAADMTPEDLDELREHGLSDPEILGVILVAAACCFLSSKLEAVGAAPDAGYANVEEPLREALTVGRPIVACADDDL